MKNTIYLLVIIVGLVAVAAKLNWIEIPWLSERIVKAPEAEQPPTGGDPPKPEPVEPVPADEPKPEVAEAKPPKAELDTQPAPEVTEAKPAPEPQPEPAPAGPVPPDEVVADLHGKYEAALASQAQEPFEAASAKLTASYLAALEREEQAAQAAADLDAVLHWRNERMRIEGQPAVGEARGDVPAKLVEMRKIYEAETAKLAETREAKERELRAKYDEALAGHVKRLTQSRKIEEALAVEEWREPYRAREEEADRLARRLQKSSVPLPKKTDSMISPFAGDEAGDEWKNGVRMKFCWCPRGEFTMGSPPNEVGRTDDEDQAEVTVSRGFWMGKFEVTEEEFEKVTGETPSLRGDSNFESKERPVAHVTWDEARKFCELLTEQEHTRGIIPEGWKYDLPTEAQWEYACRAGTTGPFVGEPPSDYGWIAHNRVELVGLKKPNPWGIHDIHGNVREFCRDAYRKELMGGVDPFIEVMGPNEQVVFRGGFYNPPAERCRAANRRHVPRSHWDHSIGFRIALFQD